MEKKNYNRLLVSLTDTVMVWLDEMSTEKGVTLPYTGQNTAACMAEAAMSVLMAVDDVHNSLSEDGQLRDE